MNKILIEMSTVSLVELKTGENFDRVILESVQRETLVEIGDSWEEFKVKFKQFLVDGWDDMRQYYHDFCTVELCFVRSTGTLKCWGY